MKEFLNKNFLGIVIIALAVLLYFDRFDGDTSRTPEPKVTTKTEYILQPPVYIPQYVPIPHSTQPPTSIPPNYVPSEDVKKLLVQYKDLLAKFLELKTYKDSIVLKDSAGNKVGIVNLEDSVTQNSITSRKPSYQLSFPKETITIREPIKPRTQLYVGGGPILSQSTLINGAKAGILIEDRKDRLYGASAQKVFGYPRLLYTLEGYWVIRLGKK